MAKLCGSGKLTVLFEKYIALPLIIIFPLLHWVKPISINYQPIYNEISNS